MSAGALWGRLRRGEQGQAMVLFALSLVVTLTAVGLSVDIGRFLWARTQMQSAVDAAALAGAQSMPNAAQSQAQAAAYWDDNAGFIKSQGENVAFAVTYPGGSQSVQVDASADIPTWFARFVGFNSWRVSASGEAESQVLDISIVLDISGSMCWDTYGPVDNGPGPYIGPGTNAPTVATAIPAGGANSITIQLSSVAIYNSTSAVTNNANFGYNTTTRYYSYTPGNGRRGLIKIDNEIFLITALNSGANTLTVTRSQTNNFTGAVGVKAAHAVGTKVSTQRSDCPHSAPAAAGPYQPFDTTITITQYFTTLFNSTWDKIGLATFSAGGGGGTIRRGLTADFTQVRADLAAIANPVGGTNSARGLALGRQILDGTGKRSNSVRILVFVTDGRANSWCNPSSYSPSAYDGSCTSGGGGTDGNATAVGHAISEAERIASEDVTIFTIGLGNAVDDAFLEQIAAIGHGSYYKAPTTADLDDAFRSIAEKTHIALTR